MRTEELIDALTRNLEPVRPRSGGLAFALALALATPTALALMLVAMGIHPGLRADIARPMFWVKASFGIALAGGALALLVRLARPGLRAGAAALAPAVPVALLWLLAGAALAAAAPGERFGLVFGASWSQCSLSIALLSAPVLAGAFAALRTLAPTRLAAAGAGAGLLAGGVGAAIYALHCPELAAPFLAVWYVLGASIPTALGALLGPRLLRW